MGRKKEIVGIVFIILIVFSTVGLLIGLPSLGKSFPAEQPAEQPAEVIHPDFAFTQESFMELLRETLDSISASMFAADSADVLSGIAQDPETFLSLLGAMLAEDEQTLFVLADKDHYLPADHVPADLESLNAYRELSLNRQDMSLRRIMIPALLAMVEAAANEGIVLDISSAYRSYAYQEQLFQRHVDQLGLEEASRVSARAGTSQHQLGSTLDFGSITPEFAGHPAGIWLAREAWKFGFSLSYPPGYEKITGYSYEPWHFRYLGQDALDLQRLFFLDIQQYLLLFYDHARAALQASHHPSE